MMKLPSESKFADEKLKEAFYKLEQGDDSEKELFRLINQALGNIEVMPFLVYRFQKN